MPWLDSAQALIESSSSTQLGRPWLHASGDLGQIEDVVDQAEQMVGAVRIFSRLPYWRRAGLLQRRMISRVKPMIAFIGVRIVAHFRQELGFRLARLLGLLHRA